MFSLVLLLAAGSSFSSVPCGFFRKKLGVGDWALVKKSTCRRPWCRSRLIMAPEKKHHALPPALGLFLSSSARWGSSPYLIGWGGLFSSSFPPAPPRLFFFPSIKTGQQNSSSSRPHAQPCGVPLSPPLLVPSPPLLSFIPVIPYFNGVPFLPLPSVCFPLSASASSIHMQKPRACCSGDHPPPFPAGID